MFASKNRAIAGILELTFFFWHRVRFVLRWFIKKSDLIKGEERNKQYSERGYRTCYHCDQLKESLEAYEIKNKKKLPPKVIALMRGSCNWNVTTTRRATPWRGPCESRPISRGQPLLNGENKPQDFHHVAVFDATHDVTVIGHVCQMSLDDCVGRTGRSDGQVERVKKETKNISGSPIEETSTEFRRSAGLGDQVPGYHKIRATAKPATRM